MAKEYRRELPGDLLELMRKQHKIASIAEFDRRHQHRVRKALEERLAREGRLDTISGDEESRMFDTLALRYDQWTNRFGVIWDASKDPRKEWRALFTSENLDALVFAGWIEEDSAIHARFENAIKLQNALYYGLSGYDDIEDRYLWKEQLDLERVYDLLCDSFLHFIRAYPETQDWSFSERVVFVNDICRTALGALADLGVIEVDPRRIDGLPGLERTRGIGVRPGQEHGQVYEGIAAWVTVLMEDSLLGMSSERSASG